MAMGLGGKLHELNRVSQARTSNSKI